MTGYLRTLAAVWLIGSLTMGTLALLVVDHTQPYGFRPLQQVSGSGRLAMLGLLVVLFGGLLVVAWRGARSWLAGGDRARLLWAVVVAVVGFAGWGYAATVTFAADFAPGWQIALAYVGSGLPFALVAAMLLRPLRVNLAAAGLALALVVTGALVAGGGVYGVLQLYVYYLYVMLGGGVYAFGA